MSDSKTTGVGRQKPQMEGEGKKEVVTDRKEREREGKRNNPIQDVKQQS